MRKQAYQVDKWWFSFYYGIVETMTSVAMLWYGFLPWLWDRSGELLAAVGWDEGGSLEVMRGRSYF